MVMLSKHELLLTDFLWWMGTRILQVRTLINPLEKIVC